MQEPHEAVAVGDSVIYIPRPGQVRCGHGEIAAMVLRVDRDPEGDRLCLLTFPPNSEPVEHDKVLPYGAGGGHIVGHCWKPKDNPRMRALEAQVEELRNFIDALTAPPG